MLTLIRMKPIHFDCHNWTIETYHPIKKHSWTKSIKLKRCLLLLFCSTHFMKMWIVCQGRPLFACHSVALFFCRCLNFFACKLLMYISLVFSASFCIGAFWKFVSPQIVHNRCSWTDFFVFVFNAKLANKLIITPIDRGEKNTQF